MALDGEPTTVTVDLELSIEPDHVDNAIDELILNLDSLEGVVLDYACTEMSQE